MSSHFQICVDRLPKRPNPQHDEEQRLAILREQIFAPTVWCRLASGYRIQDLTEVLYAPSLELMKTYFMPEDVLCKSSRLLADYMSRRSFYNACLFQMKDTTSLAVIDEVQNKDELAGICLLMAVKKIDFGRVFSRTILRHGEAYNKITDLKTALNKRVDIYADYDCEIFLRIYSVCVKSEYRRKGLGFALMRTAMQVARTLNIPIMMGIFDCYKMQQYALKLGFVVVTEIRYSDWRDDFGNVIFTDVGEKNETCALMIAKVQAEFYPDFLIEKPPVVDAVQDKKGKKDKKDKKKGDKKKGKK